MKGDIFTVGFLKLISKHSQWSRKYSMDLNSKLYICSNINGPRGAYSNQTLSLQQWKAIPVSSVFSLRFKYKIQLTDNTSINSGKI